MILMIIVKYVDIPSFYTLAYAIFFVWVKTNMYLRHRQTSATTHYLKDNVVKSTIYDIRVLLR